MVSLNDLVKVHNCPKQIDYLSIDVEGTRAATKPFCCASSCQTRRMERGVELIKGLSGSTQLSLKLTTT
jgi:hypothetical protein